MASSQDALVEEAIAELARRERDADDTQVWQQAADDAGFQGEVQQIEVEFFADDLAAWKQ
ncbi:MAG: hypothetical protein ACRDGS_09600 [Chloroflexota bacterium]